MRFVVLLGAALVFGACSPQPATEAPAPASAVETTTELATVTTPASGAHVTSPLQVSGVAPADWFFENQFPVGLIDANGAEIAMAPAHPRVSWTDPGPKEYDAELTFTATGPATLVLEEDMPGEGNEPRQVRIPVVLQ
ncbi:MAG: hypothetical protein JNL81_10205 [Hyphomonadaceae bacterium]|nr:hypothetical protein [Hyphomonadaceae bacterium]